MRDYLKYKYNKVYSEQSRLPSIRFLLKLLSNKNILTKSELISKSYPSSFFNSKLTLEKAIRMMTYYGLIDKKKEEYSLTEYGYLAIYAIQNKAETEFLEILNYSSYVNNFTYHLIIDLLYFISEKQLSGSTDFFSQMSNIEQYSYIQNKIEESVEKKIHKRYIRYYTHFIRRMGIIDNFGYMPKLRKKVWLGIFLISFSDVLKMKNQLNKGIVLTELMIKDIIAPLFLSKDTFYSFLNREILYPYFKIIIENGNKYYIQIDRLVNPITIIEENI